MDASPDHLSSPTCCAVGHDHSGYLHRIADRIRYGDLCRPWVAVHTGTVAMLYEAILCCNMMLCLYGAMLHSCQLINRIHTAVCITQLQGFCAIPAVLMVLLKGYVPESPKWLLMQSSTFQLVGAASTLHVVEDNVSSHIHAHEKYQKVFSILRRLRPVGYDVDAEITDIIADAKSEALSQSDSSDVTWTEVQ